MLRLFLSRIEGNACRLANSDFHYISRVLRLTSGQKIEIAVSQKSFLLAEIISLSNSLLEFKIIEERVIPKNTGVEITLAQCLPRQNKFSDILKKCTELGVNSFVPIISSRVVSRPKEDKLDKKNARWEKVLISATSQSKQFSIPLLYPIMKLKELLIFTQKNSFDLKLVFWEEERSTSLKSVLQNFKKSLSTTDIPLKVLVFIGPEGGLSQDEVSFLQQDGFIPVSLGSTVLRVENAGLVACANTLYELH